MPKKQLLFLIITAVLVTLTTRLVQAEDSYEPRSGFYIGLGGALGYEANAIQRVGGGGIGQLGYRFSDQFALHLESGGYFTSRAGVNYTFIPVTPTLLYFIVDGLYAYSGFGYEMMRVTSGASFGAVGMPGTTYYSGFTVDSGIGYEFWMGEQFTLAPQFGLNYAHIADGDLYTPLFRATVQYHF
ncbi:MAG: hypothetical protein HYS22_05335 [Deltaproteobacteria bacterium]|nr:hypothetical protein [Deltaproteobacteria bacterium]